MYLHTLLATVPADERIELVRHTRIQSYRRSEVVMGVDDASECIYCVAHGLLRVVVSDSSGGEEVTTDFVKRDEIHLASAFAETRHRARTSLIAVLPSSVHIVPWQQFSALCSKYPEILLALLKIGVRRTVMLRKQRRLVSCSASETLISRALHDLTQLAPVGDSGYDKRITQAVIASYTGLSREQVNKTMREFEDRGLIWKDEHGVHVSADFAYADYQEATDATDEFSRVDPTAFAELPDEFGNPNDPARKADSTGIHCSDHYLAD